MADNESGVGGFGYFLAGLGIGALIGVLYAPKAGKETREDLVAGALDAKDKATVYAQQGAQKATDLYGQGAQKASDLVEQGKQAAGTYVDQGKDYLDKGKTQWSQYVDKGKDLIATQKEGVAAAVGAATDAYTSKTSTETNA